MPRKRKQPKTPNTAVDRAQQKAQKQKRTLFVLLGVLALSLVYEVPHVLKLMHQKPRAVVMSAAGSAPAPNPTSGGTASAGALPPTTPTAAPATPSIVDSVQVTPDPGQLTQFQMFASKDPFNASVQSRTSTTPGGGSAPAAPKAPPAPPAPTVPKAPPAPPPTAAVISLNGQLMSVGVGTDFPSSGLIYSRVGALFHLVSLTDTSAKVAINGGSYATGAPALTLTVDKPVTLQNTADGTQYTLILEPQGTPLPAAPPTSNGTTATTPAPTATTPSVLPTAGSGG